MADTGEAGRGEDILGRLIRKDLRLFFLRNPMPMCLFDPDTTRILEVNEAAVACYGYSREEFLSKSLYEIRWSEHSALDEGLLQATVGRSEEGVGSWSGLRHRRKDGAPLWVNVYYQNVAVGARPIRLAMIHDATQLHHFADKAAEQGEYFRQLFVGSRDAIAMLDTDHVIIDVNPSFESLFQYSKKEALGKRIDDLVVPPEREAESAAISALSRTGMNERVDTVRRRKDGTAVHVRLTGYPVVVRGRTVGVYAIYQDRTNNRKLTSELSYQASHDQVTGLINRREFERAAAELLANSTAGHRGFALLHIDLDHFKLINDSLGTEAGERILCESASLLRGRSRSGDLLARIGNGEFALLLCDVTLPIAERFASRLAQRAAAKRFVHAGQAWPLRFCIGVMHRGADGDQTIADLASGAAMASRLAGEAGDRHVGIFRADDRDLRRQRDDVIWGTRVADAISQKRLILFLQKISPAAAPNEGSRYEVLLRLLDESGVPMPPGALIAAAERFRMMPLVDRYVIDLALAHVRQSCDLGSELPDIVSINISGMSLGSRDLASFISSKIAQYRVAPGMLCFEVTETAAIRNLDVAAAFIAEMRALGCKVALDDFGTGMASLAYLRNFDVDYVKIDGQFIRDLINNPFDLATVESLNRLAQIKGFKTVAECVENEETLLRLRELGVDFVQGFYLHKPEAWVVGNLPLPRKLLSAQELRGGAAAQPLGKLMEAAMPSGQDGGRSSPRA
ncbi:MAG TPA: EAL domain-containing protein, partial [Nevskia sp.]|nr:EAL domain-containing protein [Nevskia sp.]